MVIVERDTTILIINSTGQCVRCHSVKGQGGTVGPSLTNIPNDLSREELLQALVEPSARLSPGFGTVLLTLSDVHVIADVLMEEHKDELIVKTSQAEPMGIHVSRIKKEKTCLRVCHQWVQLCLKEKFEV